MRYFDAKKKAADILREAGVDDAKNDSEYLLMEASGMDRGTLFMKLFEEMGKEEEDRFFALAERRRNHEPLQYIIGSQSFMGFTFKVSEDVLIPRFDTEVLAELAIKRAEEYLDEQHTAADGNAAGNDCVPVDGSSVNIRMLDICTGSGCVAVSVGLGLILETKKKKRKAQVRTLHGNEDCKISIEVHAADISEKAVRLAKENLNLNIRTVFTEDSGKDTGQDTGFTADGITYSPKFFVSDLFNNIEGKYDMITANPPYIVHDEISKLSPEITEHEPRLALDGGEDGMDFYRRICKEAPGYLKKNGSLLMELDDFEAEDVEKMMLAAGFSEVKIYRDLMGLRRVIEGRISDKE